MTATKTSEGKAPTKVKKATKPAATKSAATKSAATEAGPDARDGCNLAVVRGIVSSPPEVRVLPSETVLVQLQVTTRLETETLSMPGLVLESGRLGRDARARGRDRGGRPGPAPLLPGRRGDGVPGRARVGRDLTGERPSAGANRAAPRRTRRWRRSSSAFTARSCARRTPNCPVRGVTVGSNRADWGIGGPAR